MNEVHEIAFGQGEGLALAAEASDALTGGEIESFEMVGPLLVELILRNNLSIGFPAIGIATTVLVDLGHFFPQLLAGVFGVIARHPGHNSTGSSA